MSRWRSGRRAMLRQQVLSPDPARPQRCRSVEHALERSNRVEVGWLRAWRETNAIPRVRRGAGAKDHGGARRRPSWTSTSSAGTRCRLTEQPDHFQFTGVFHDRFTVHSSQFMGPYRPDTQPPVPRQPFAAAAFTQCSRKHVAKSQAFAGVPGGAARSRFFYDLGLPVFGSQSPVSSLQFAVKSRSPSVSPSKPDLVPAFHRRSLGGVFLISR